MAQKVPLAVEWVNANTDYTAVAVKDLNGNITGMTVNGLNVGTINIGDATTDSVIYVKVDGKDVVADGTSVAKTVTGVLSAAGKTLSSANLYVYVDTAGTKTAAVSNAATNVADGAIIDTNNDKGYFSLTASTVTAVTTGANTGNSIDTGTNTPIMALVVADGDKVTTTTAGATTLVKADATLKVTLKFTTAGTVGTKDLKAAISATGATAAGTFASAAVIPEFAKGTAFTVGADGTTAEMEFTFSAIGATAVSVITVTFSE